MRWTPSFCSILKPHTDQVKCRRIMTYHFYNCLKLIKTVNDSYQHIVELDELCTLFETSANTSNFWRDEVKIEYNILSKICYHTRENNYGNEHPEWDVDNILAKIEGKTREEIEAMDITTIIPIKIEK